VARLGPACLLLPQRQRDAAATPQLPTNWVLSCIPWLTLSHSHSDPPPYLPARLQVFDFERWKKHRSSSRYLRHALGIFESRIVSGLAQPLAYVMAVCGAVATYHLAAEVRPAPPSSAHLARPHS
jgi:hypothetical protein